MTDQQAGWQQEFQDNLNHVRLIRKDGTTISVMAMLTAVQAETDRESRIDQMELLRWKYKELNGQSVDSKFLEAYNILMDELSAHPKPGSG